jgi:competence ComEA-like helix-hairpin-helix protein
MAKHLKEAAIMWIAVFILAMGVIKVSQLLASGLFPVDEEGNWEQSSLLNINTVSVDALAALPYVGKTKAQAMLAYHQQHGPFKAVEDVKQVSGIEEQIFANSKDRITVGEDEQSPLANTLVVSEAKGICLD